MNKALAGGVRWGRVLVQVAAYPLTASSKTRRQIFRFAEEAFRHHLPIVSLSQIVNGRLADKDKISLQAIPEHRHNCSIFELLTLAALTRSINPKLCLEIGTYDGRSALAIASNCNAQARIVTLNLPPNYLSQHPDESNVVDVQLSSKVTSGARWQGCRESHQIEQVFADSKEFDFSSIGRPQFIFIDGAHDRHSVQSDTDKALRVIDRQKGLVVWHDARDYGVRPVLKRLYKSGSPVSIVEHTNIAVLLFESGTAVQLI
jgi:predicted O-methyltransferase YrrM